jgi:hypothetical protein
MEEASEGI